MFILSELAATPLQRHQGTIKKQQQVTVLLHQVLQAALFEELRLILLEIANDFGSSLNFPMHQLRVFLHGEAATSTTLLGRMLRISS